jgi:hypothetical protein
VAEVRAKLAPGTPVEVCSRTKCGSGRRTSSPTVGLGRAPTAHDQRIDLLFGAACPDRGACTALVLPACNSEVMQLHLDEITHAILILDQAGWHGAKELRFRTISPYCRCRRAHPSSTAKRTSGSACVRTGCQTAFFKSFDDIVDHCCYAWNTLIGQPWKIISIAGRDWATVDYSL